MLCTQKDAQYAAELAKSRKTTVRHRMKTSATDATGWGGCRWKIDFISLIRNIRSRWVSIQLLRTLFRPAIGRFSDEVVTDCNRLSLASSAGTRGGDYDALPKPARASAI